MLQNSNPPSRPLRRPALLAALASLGIAVAAGFFLQTRAVAQEGARNILRASAGPVGIFEWDLDNDGVFDRDRSLRTRLFGPGATHWGQARREAPKPPVPLRLQFHVTASPVGGEAGEPDAPAPTEFLIDVPTEPNRMSAVDLKPIGIEFDKRTRTASVKIAVYRNGFTTDGWQLRVPLSAPTEEPPTRVFIEAHAALLMADDTGGQPSERLLPSASLTAIDWGDGWDCNDGTERSSDPNATCGDTLSIIKYEWDY